MARDVPGLLDVMEGELIVRWRDIMASLPRGTTNEDYGYSQRQLEYFSMILEQVLRMKDASLQVGTLLVIPARNNRERIAFACAVTGSLGQLQLLEFPGIILLYHGASGESGVSVEADSGTGEESDSRGGGS